MTPIPAIKDFLRSMENDIPVFSNIDPIDVLDPCAGGDTKHPMSYPTAINELYPWACIHTLDIRDDSLARMKTDYLTYELQNKPDVIITNPPFNQALPIIQKALKDVKDGGYVIMLLRLNFFGSDSRYPFFKEYLPKYAYVHHKRMGFTDGGGTDSIEYMHTVWQKGYNPTHTLLKVI